MRWIEKRQTYEKIIKNNIDYEIIVNNYSKVWLDEIVAVMVDVVCSDEPTIRINKQEYPHEVVKSRFLKINSTHIEYIDMALRNNTSDVRNIRAFLINVFRQLSTQSVRNNKPPAMRVGNKRLLIIVIKKRKTHQPPDPQSWGQVGTLFLNKQNCSLKTSNFLCYKKVTIVTVVSLRSTPISRLFCY